MNFIKIAYKKDMSYDFYIKHNVHAVESKLIAIISKSETLINKTIPKLRHPLVRNFNHVPILNMYF